MPTKSDIPALIVALCGPKDDLAEARGRAIETEMAAIDKRWGNQSLPIMLFVSAVMRNMTHAHREGAINSLHLPITLSLLGQIGEVLLASIRHQNGPDVNPFDSDWLDAYQKTIILNKGGNPFGGSFEEGLDENGDPIGNKSFEPYTGIQDTKPENVVELHPSAGFHNPPTLLDPLRPDGFQEDPEFEAEMAAFEAELEAIAKPRPKVAVAYSPSPDVSPEEAAARAKAFHERLTGLYDGLKEHWGEEDSAYICQIAGTIQNQLASGMLHGDMNKLHMLLSMWAIGQIGNFYHADWCIKYPTLHKVFDPSDATFAASLKGILDEATLASAKSAQVIIDPSCPDSPPTPSTGSGPDPETQP